MRLHFALVALLALVSSCLADQEGNIADLRSDELPGIYGIQFFRDTNVSARITAFGYVILFCTDPFCWLSSIWLDCSPLAASAGHALLFSIF
jgi:hypothetical protein